MSRKPTPAPCDSAGFTLVELLVALAAMALLAVMAWRGLDAMARAQEQTRVHSDDVMALQAGLAQWGTDLDALTQMPALGGLAFDGRVLRITRIYRYDGTGSAAGAAEAGSVRVVAWGAAMVDGKRQWLRWQSGPLRERAELQAAWQQAALWGQNPSDVLRQQQVAVVAVDDWQVYYFRNNAWTNALSTAVGEQSAPASGQAALPDGVRLVLTLSGGQTLSGKLTRDWARPAAGKS